MPATRRNNWGSNANEGTQNARQRSRRVEQRYANRFQSSQLGGFTVYTRTLATSIGTTGASAVAPSTPARPAGVGQRGLAVAANASGLCGYEARFESPLDKKYVCPVCLSALRDPLQTKCGHRFCATCLSRASGYAL